MSTQKNVRINRDITAREVRVIDADGAQAGVISLREALTLADEAGLDLVEVSPTANPPVCKVMDFGKYKFEQSKKQAAAKKNQKQVQIKEIKFRPGTDVGDYQIKLTKILGFLEKGDKVKCTLRFRGREMQHKELGMELLNRLRADSSEQALVEQEPKFEGRQMMMVLAPKK
ncbi:MAG: translation initiation factor IF-3 [Gammaproteobacteria bacterium CG11_big_fil_rev_8_21_14_0_20_46_22]|nr:MAG: translation initiation factor IF-3 [Gammaproteobacteria bacterium CG12_big_fil_rev_8_21_14_0_65_46_12]PIR11575.1 MAG: translation initiation factor IF-3 [Gammaproteobacteria bacterium CG11_big_fil_rev_8_21_14_0_20_46_22]